MFLLSSTFSIGEGLFSREEYSLQLDRVQCLIMNNLPLNIGILQLFQFEENFCFLEYRH